MKILQNTLSTLTALAFLITTLMPGLNNVAVVQAATVATSFSGSLVIQESSEEVVAGDTSSFEDLSYSFNYEGEGLDNGDSLSFGWRESGGSDNQLGTIDGANESASDTSTLTDETGSESGPLPSAAELANLEFYFNNVGSSADDDVTITNFVLSGTEVLSACTPQLDASGTTDIQNSNTGDYFDSINDALADCDTSDGDTIVLLGDITTTEQQTLNRPIVIDGNNNTLNADFLKSSNSNNSAIGVQADDVEVRNLTLVGLGDAPWPDQLHGINAYEASNLLLEDINSSDFEGSGIVINSSEATARNISTSSNGWHGINVDQKTSDSAVLNIYATSSHGESLPQPHIYVDDASKDVTVNDVDNQYNKFSGLEPNSEYYLLKSGPIDPDPNDEHQFNVSGFKFNNLNGDRDRDEGEEKLAGWEFRQYEETDNGWVLIDTDTTDENGVYNFKTIYEPGTYHICEVMQPGWEQVYQDWSGTPYHVITDNQSPNATEEGPYCATDVYTDEADRSSKSYFGNMMSDLPAIGAAVHVDQYPGTEMPDQRYLFRLYNGDFSSLVDERLTNKKGHTQFRGVDLGNYNVCLVPDGADVTAPAGPETGEVPTKENRDTVANNSTTGDEYDTCYAVEVTANEKYAGHAFIIDGDLPSIGAAVHIDQYPATEFPEEQQTFRLYDADFSDLIEERQSNDEGHTRFRGLTLGTYNVCYVPGDNQVLRPEGPEFNEVETKENRDTVANGSTAGDEYDVCYEVEVTEAEKYAGHVWVIDGDDQTPPTPGQCDVSVMVNIDQSSERQDVDIQTTTYLLDGQVLGDNSDFDLFVYGDDQAEGNYEDQVRVERTVDGFQLYYYGNDDEAGIIKRFSGSFQLPSDTDYSAAMISEGNEPLETTGNFIDEVSVNTITGEVEFTLYVSTGNDSFVLSGVELSEDCDDEDVDPSPETDGGGSGALASTSIGDGDEDGEVAGVTAVSPDLLPGATPDASTCDDPFLTSYMNRYNNPSTAEVTKLQLALRFLDNIMVPLTGTYGVETENAVKAYQLKYSDEILAPWGLVLPTGYVYLTTREHINERVCDDYSRVIENLEPDSNILNTVKN